MFVIQSCTSAFRKHISEPLSIKEIRSISKNNPSFVDMYENIEDIREELFDDLENEIKYGDITYKRFFKYEKKRHKLIKNALEEYQSKYDDNKSFQEKVDSALQYWLDYSDVYKYVRIKLISLYPRIEKRGFYPYNYYLDELDYTFSIEPLDSNLSFVSYYCRISDDDLYDYISCEDSIPMEKKYALYSHEKKFSYYSKKVKEDLNTSRLENLSKVNVSYIIVGDKVIKERAGIPSHVMDYINHSDWGFNRLDFIQKEVDQNYVSPADYIDANVNKNMEKYDKKVYDLFEMYWDY